jgi:D-alanyl-D-alanine carboxypeptidase
LVKDEGEPDFMPGTAFKYSNTNYLLLGVLIEFLTQRSLATVFQERIFSKIGMHNSFLSEGVLGSNQPAIAHGYDEEFGKIYDGQEFHSGTSWAAGGLVSTTQDLNLFLRSLPANKVFKHDSTFLQMIRTGANEWYGLGVFVKEHPVAGPCFGHGGGVFGTNSTAFYFFNNNAIITCSITLDGSREFISPEDLLDLIIDILP